MNLKNENLQRTKEYRVERPRGHRPALSISLASSFRQASRVWDFPCLLPLPTLPLYPARHLERPGWSRICIFDGMHKTLSRSQEVQDCILPGPQEKERPLTTLAVNGRAGHWPRNPFLQHHFPQEEQQQQ